MVHVDVVFHGSNPILHFPPLSQHEISVQLWIITFTREEKGQIRFVAKARRFVLNAFQCKERVCVSGMHILIRPCVTISEGHSFRYCPPTFRVCSFLLWLFHQQQFSVIYHVCLYSVCYIHTCYIHKHYLQILTLLRSRQNVNKTNLERTKRILPFAEYKCWLIRVWGRVWYM